MAFVEGTREMSNFLEDLDALNHSLRGNVINTG